MPATKTSICSSSAARLAGSNFARAALKGESAKGEAPLIDVAIRQLDEGRHPIRLRQTSGIMVAGNDGAHRLRQMPVFGQERPHLNVMGGDQALALFIGEFLLRQQSP